MKTLESIIWGAHGLFQRHWKKALRIRERIRVSEEAVHLVLAGFVGVIGGFINLFFYYAIESVKFLFFGFKADPVEVAELLGRWERLVIPAMGGLAAGLVLYGGLRLIGKQGPANMLEVVVAGDGRLPFRSAVVKGISSLLSIGTGSSIGREGAITQMTATLASKWGQLMKWQPYRLRLLVACGAASGIAAAYNAPIAGAVFAALIVLGNFSMNLFAPLVFASVVATMLSRSFFGITPWYYVPAFDFTKVTELPWFVVLGLLAGALGAVFLKMLKRAEEFFLELKVPIYMRLALAGMIVGILATEFPGVWGSGYVVTSRILEDSYPLQFLVLLFLAKLLATLASIGSGTVGGVMTPTLFLGASLGAAFGSLLHAFGSATALPTGAFALVGMGCTLAATTHSPLLAMILVFEISLNYSLMPALMVACVVSSLLGRRLHPNSVYSEQLRFKEMIQERETARVDAATMQTVGEVMRAPVPPVRETATLRQIADRFLTSSNNFLPVVDAEQKLLGIVSLQDLKEYLGAGEELSAVIAYDVMRPPPPCTTPNQRLLDVLPILLRSEQRNIPVVNNLKENRLLGSLARAEVLGLLSEAISAKSGIAADAPKPEPPASGSNP